MKRTFLIFATLVLTWASEPSSVFAQGEISGTIYSRGDFQPLSISLVRFQASSGASEELSMGEEISSITRKDLIFSMFFDVLDENLVSLNDAADLNPQDQDIWLRTEAQFLIAGKIETQSNFVKAYIYLYDAFGRKKLFSQSYRAPQATQRKLGHEISNDILNNLTGEPGIFATRLALIGNGTGNKELYICDYDGFNLQQVTYDRTINLSPSWSPDGEDLIYTSYKSGNPDLWEVPLETGKPRKLANFKGLNTAARWNPKGNLIALTLSVDQDPELYVVNSRGENPRRLTYSFGVDSSPSWSPNGKQIAFTSDRTGAPQIYVMNVDGSDVRRLSVGLPYCDSPAWSPRGDKIAFVVRESNGFQVYTMEITGENPTRLTDQGSNENPSWSPDGYHLTFASSRSGQFEIYTMNWNGTNQTKITTGGGHTSSAWSPKF